MTYAAEQWKEIPGFDGYEASTEGRIRSYRGRGGFARILTPHIDRHNGKAYKCRMTILRNGSRVSVQVARLVFITWIGPIPDGMIVYCRDGDVTNTRPANLALSTPSKRFSERAKKVGGSNRRPVVKIDTSLEVIAAYRSTCEAARLNGLERSLIQDQCNLQIKSSVLAPDGFIYAWDEEKWLRKTLKRAMADFDALGIPYTDPCTEEYWNLPPEEDTDPTASIWFDAPPAGGGASDPAF